MLHDVDIVDVRKYDVHKHCVKILTHKYDILTQIDNLETNSESIFFQ